MFVHPLSLYELNSKHNLITTDNESTNAKQIFIKTIFLALKKIHNINDDGYDDINKAVTKNLLYE
ncbi:hypothetical protein BpHYR1_054454 [Brachionus plicatilis]|uniref:Uncharacterized protein n=1 Tax=Brachionus plicatilis TaxID=10195 RepID=A0A3M7R3C5_BRAPC|nr:hypothetical protein BpHYR1_054454 [Brachionus plicatilis]